MHQPEGRVGSIVVDFQSIRVVRMFRKFEFALVAVIVCVTVFVAVRENLGISAMSSSRS